MKSTTSYLLVADLILLTHVLFVAFVVFGLLLVLAGKLFAWHWVRSPWFRLAHLASIGVVMVQSWLGVVCPLTVWENSFRDRAGEDVYSGSFISHWLQRILYYEAPEWVFIVCYTVFALLVVASWFWVPPNRFAHPRSDNKS